MNECQIRKRVYESNMELHRRNIILYSWGNVSEIDRSEGLMYIKPSGVDYEILDPDDIVPVDIRTGRALEGSLKPSVDTNTHLEIYRSFSSVGGVTHTHSTCAVSFAQAGMSIPALGTTHADHFCGDIPCSRNMTDAEIETDYETNTGKVIVETINDRGYDPLHTPGILVRNHGPFTFGKDAPDSVFNAIVLEKIAEIAINTLMLNPNSDVSDALVNKHFNRKHGSAAYYGQK